jgi:hypothetical protein
MVLHGAKIYNDGVSLENGVQEKVQKIINVVKMLSPEAELSLRLIKGRRASEVLLWGKVGGIPIGVYKRGLNLANVLDSLYDKVKKDCVKIWRSGQYRKHSPTQPIAMAG